MPLTEDDEFLHPPPEGSSGLWSDNFWFSVVDREADVFGINHISASLSHGYLRASAFFVIDGTSQQWASRQALDVDVRFACLGDARLRYTVLEPFKRVRWEFEGPRFGFDLEYIARFQPFDYSDCMGGNPLAAFEDYGGHYEQAYRCVGEFEAYGGPRAGERRRIDSFAHRDHSWTHRFSRAASWEPKHARTLTRSLGHFWPSVQLPGRHLNAFGWMNPEHPLPDGTPRSGGWLADEDGARAIESAVCTGRFEEDGRTAMAFDMVFHLANGTVLTVLTGRKHAHTRNGLMRDENDAEARLDCHEPFFDFEVVETGERGYGVMEYSMNPPEPRYRY